MFRVELSKNEKGFWFFELREGAHDHIRYRVWVNKAFLNEVPKDLSFPVKGAKVEVTEKGAFVLRRTDDGSWVALVKEPSGYRGRANLEFEGDYHVVASGEEFHPPQGSLSEAWALVNVKSPELTVYTHETGKLISKEEYSYRLFPDGSARDLYGDEVAWLNEV